MIKAVFSLVPYLIFKYTGDVDRVTVKFVTVSNLDTKVAKAGLVGVIIADITDGCYLVGRAGGREASFMVMSEEPVTIVRGEKEFIRNGKTYPFKLNIYFGD